MTDTETTEAEAPAAPEPHPPCLCDCGGVPTRKRSRFLPGHDAQLKASLYRTIRDTETNDEDRAAAVAKLDDFGWPQPAPKKAKATKTETNGDEAPAES
jgi:hypothetical protein